VLKAWLAERAGGAPDEPLFPTRTGTRLSRDALEHRLAIHLQAAARNCPSITGKHITMHTLRHTAPVRLLLAGNDITVIALWLGHEQIATTNTYLHADLTHKQQAIDRTRRSPPNPAATAPPTRRSRSSKPSDCADLAAPKIALSSPSSTTSA
jgi:site-specific recombinase XerC